MGLLKSIINWFKIDVITEAMKEFDKLYERYLQIEMSTVKNIELIKYVINNDLMSAKEKLDKMCSKSNKINTIDKHLNSVENNLTHLNNSLPKLKQPKSENKSIYDANSMELM